MNRRLILIALGVFFLNIHCFSQGSNNQQRQLFAPSTNLASVDLEIVYHFTAIRDSTSLETTEEIMLLQIGENYSNYESQLAIRRRTEMAKIVSQNPDISTPELMRLTRNTVDRSRFRTKIIKDFKQNIITTFDRVFADQYKYVEPVGLMQWHITGNEKSFMGYKIQEATTTYGCRDWTAWFTPDVPINDGPYKFHGLPGLIIKLEDTQGYFSFELISINKPESLVAIEYWKDSRIPTTLADFIRVRNNFSNDAASIVGNFTTDAHTSAVAASNAARRNNFIELCAD